MIVGLSGVAGSGKDFIADLLVNKHGFVKVALADPLKRICKDIFDFSDDQLWGPSEKRNQPDKRYFTGRVKTETGIVDYKDDKLFTVLDKTARGSSELTEEEILECRKVYLTPRFALQQLGTNWGRFCYENIWIDHTLRIAKKLLSVDNYQYNCKRGLWHDVENSYSKPNGVVISDVRFANEMEAIRLEGGKVVRIINDRPTTLHGDAALHVSEQEQIKIPNSFFDYLLYNRTDLNSLTEELSKMLKELT